MLLATMRKAAMLLMAMFGFAAVSLAQTTVSGTVTDKKGEPQAGVTVSIKGTKTATSTDAKGVYTLKNVPADAVLVYTGAGISKKQIGVSGNSLIDIQVETSIGNLNEVVVVGYGTRKVKDLTGSVATVSAKDFNKGVISSPQELFQGRTPGVTVTPSSGEPGAALSVNIRGANSIYNSEPLYVVDGVPVYGGGSSGTGGSNSSTSTGVEGYSTPKNPLIFLNPNDIESITILKDASSTAIYGAAGANGVIIITTKGGKGKKGSFQFGTSVSISKTASRYDLLNSEQFLVGVKNANIAAGTSPADAAAAVINVDKGANTNWQNQIFQTGVAQNYSLGWGFANKGTALRLSGAYDDQKGIVKNSSLKRASVRANFSQKFWKERLKFDANLSYANIKNEYAPNSNNAGYQGSLIGAAIAFNPTNPINNPDGSFYDPLDGNRNPVEMLAYFKDNDNVNRFLGNFSLSYKIIEGLTYKITLGIDQSKSLRKSFADPRLSSNAFGGTNFIGTVDLKNGINGNGRAVYQDKKYASILVDHLLTYDKKFKRGHELNAFVGFHYQSVDNYTVNNVRWGLATPLVKPTDVFIMDINNFNKGIPYPIGDTVKGTEQSYFAKLNYIIAEKYYFSGSVRVDGDSRFGKNNKYGTFPALGFKWRISSEAFAKQTIGKVFNELSLRLGYGIVGSKGSVPPYGSLAVRQVYNLGAFGATDQTISNANPYLKWESTVNTGIGLDFALFNNRLKGSVEYYYRNTKDLIFFKYVGARSTSPNTWSNLSDASVINKGVEVNLNYLLVQGKKFQWEVMYNMSFNKNKVIDLPTPINTGVVNGQGLSGAYAQQIVNNYPLFTWKMPVYLGLDGNGNARYENGSNDKLLGSPLPTFNAGLTNNFTYDNWNASIFFNASTGFYVYNNTANALFLKGSLKTAHNVTQDVLNSPESPINPGSVSSRFLEKGDFLRLSNASIGYTFKITRKNSRSDNKCISRICPIKKRPPIDNAWVV